jgi:NitT/TauT family transport system substrate-binding protein
MNRRAFVAGLTAAGATGLVGLRPHEAAAEPPPETITLRLFKTGSICWTPQYVAEELLRDEGFDQVIYRNMPSAAQSHSTSRPAKPTSA